MLPFLEARGSRWKALHAAGVWLRIAILLAAGFGVGLWLMLRVGEFMGAEKNAGDRWLMGVSLVLMFLGPAAASLWLAVRTLVVFGNSEVALDSARLHLRPVPAVTWRGSPKRLDLAWDKVRFLDGRGGQLVVVTDEGRVMIPDVYGVALDELGREIARRADVEPPVALAWDGFWTDAPHIRALIDRQLAKFPEAERALVDGRRARRLITIEAYCSVLALVPGAMLVWMGLGFLHPTLQDEFPSDVVDFMYWAGVVCIAAGACGLALARPYRTHDFWLVRPEFVIAGMVRGEVLAAASIAAVEPFREGRNKGVSVRLRDGSSVRLRYAELEEPIRRLALKQTAGSSGNSSRSDMPGEPGS